MPMFPGFSQREEHHILDKKKTTETVNSNSKSLFVSARNCEETDINILGKIGKLTLENCDTIKVHLSDNIISGTLEVIKCKNVEIRYGEEAKIPVVQVDDSSKVHVYIQKKSQLDSIIFIRSHDVKLFLENVNVEGENGLTLQYEVSANDSLDVQRIGYWNTGLSGSDFIVKNRSEYSNL